MGTCGPLTHSINTPSRIFLANPNPPSMSSSLQIGPFALPWALLLMVLAVVAGNTIYLRGQIGQDLDSRESVGIGDVEAQAEKAMANIDMLLREAGSELGDIVKVVVYLTDIRFREPVYRVMGRWLKGVFPVSTGLVVTALARPEWLVEIDATAVIPADRTR